MPPQKDPSRPRHRRVSITELPRLSRANAFDIELYYLKLHLKNYCKQYRKAISRAFKKTPRIAMEAAKTTGFRKFGAEKESEDEGDGWDVGEVRYLTDKCRLDGYCMEV
ncbi:hypothetical protein F5Y03DRAFT_397809 [Xylaria venustula]|nr:hypothetical protein F5Y03DRAFT_397809 [Xylaria venustula]